MKKIAIVIPNLNLSYDTVETIKCLVEQVLPKEFSLQIIIVDNGSSDDSVKIINNSCKNVVVLELPDNRGVAGGYNAGINYALKNNCDYIIASNNDLLIKQKNCLDQLIRALESNPKIGIVGPKIYFAPGFVFHKDKYEKQDLNKIIWYAGGIIDWKNILMSHRGVDEVDNQKYGTQIEPDFITGAFMLFKAEVFKKIGGFNDNYFAYLEDVEICTRAKLAGFKLLFEPKAVIFHKVSRTSDGIGGKWNDYYITRNRLQFGMKYAALRTKFALLREALKLLFTGRQYQREGIRDFLTFRFGEKIFET